MQGPAGRRGETSLLAWPWVAPGPDLPVLATLVLYMLPHPSFLLLWCGDVGAGNKREIDEGRKS